MTLYKNLNKMIEESITYLKAMRQWNNDAHPDEQTNANIKNWFYKLLVKVEAMSKEIDSEDGR